MLVFYTHYLCRSKSGQIVDLQPKVHLKSLYIDILKMAVSYFSACFYLLFVSHNSYRAQYQL